jgi:hypothetical protein
MLAWPMISCSILDGYPAWIMSDAAVCRRSWMRNRAFLAVHLLGQLARQEPGDGDGASLMGLRRPQDNVAADVGVSTPHVDSPADQIDAAHA